MNKIKLLTLIFVVGLSAVMFFAEATSRTRNVPNGTTIILGNI